MKRLEQKILPIIKAALKEDIGRGDITTQLVIPTKKRTKAVILAKEAGMVCGLDVARLVFKAVDKRIRFKPKASYGKRIKKGQTIARLEGNARNILKAERVALNFLGRLCGIATLTDKFVQKVKPYPVKSMDTRKTTPTLRILEKYAVRCAGGFNHRMGLWDQILIKDNHVSVLGWKDLIRQIKKTKPKGIKIEVEVRNLREFKQALEADLDVIMLDNFNLKDIRKAVKIRNKILSTRYERLKLEVSGGVNLNNVRKIAACGVEMISVGELTHSAKALDVALNCE